jgi:hypothetical protein
MLTSSCLRRFVALHITRRRFNRAGRMAPVRILIAPNDRNFALSRRRRRRISRRSYGACQDSDSAKRPQLCIKSPKATTHIAPVVWRRAHREDRRPSTNDGNLYMASRNATHVQPRRSYNGYYPSLPSWRRGFDSHSALHHGPPLAGFFIRRRMGVERSARSRTGKGRATGSRESERGGHERRGMIARR